MENFMGALVCLKNILVRPYHRQYRGTPIKHQTIQSVHSIKPNDRIFNKIVKLFVDPGHSKNGHYYSRAIVGEPVCAYVQTDKEAWLVAVTRSVQLEWPGYNFSEKAMTEHIMGIVGEFYSGTVSSSSCGNVYGCHIHRLNLDDYAKEQSPEGYKILRQTECPDILVFSMSGKYIDLKNKIRIQKKQPSATRQNTNHEMWNIHAPGTSGKYKHRIQSVFTPETLDAIWSIYADYEKDPTRFHPKEIHGEPGDKKNPVARFHISLYADDFSSCHGGWGCIPGVEAVDSDGRPYHKVSRLDIPPPPHGIRLLSKYEFNLLNTEPVKALDYTN